MKHARQILASFALAVAVFAPSAAADVTSNGPGQRFLIAEVARPNPDGDVLEVAAATGQFTRFLAAVEAAGYGETLRGEGPFTVFAPTDDAFRRMEQAEFERLMQPQNREELLAILAYHVVTERVTSENFGRRAASIESASGHRLAIDARDGMRVNDQLVAMPDISASNGIIHGVNAVLMPPVLVASR